MSEFSPGASAANHLAIYIPTLAGGGAERSMLRLAADWVSRGYKVDLVLNRIKGEYESHLPAGVRVIELKRGKKWWARLAVMRAYPKDFFKVVMPVLLARKPIMTLRYLTGLADYLKEHEPRALLSALFYANLLAIWAKELSGVQTRICISQHTTLSKQIERGISTPGEQWRWQFLPNLVKSCYVRAAAIITVSSGAAEDLAKIIGATGKPICTIYNPVVTSQLNDLSMEEVDHPWFQDNQVPVILGAGRLEAVKDFSTLIRAFKRVREQRMARLVIIGDGSLKIELKKQICSLGVENDVQLLGWVDNPYAYMSRASVFVLSSIWEGLGNVLIEAMACGCPVASTDCPNGPREILEGGRYGPLTPVGDDEALSNVVMELLESSIDLRGLKERAYSFSVDVAAKRYLETLLD